jgi:crotonobetainyl-CoA:carnitine CoA-transferase CaiB-like acyl-CoA transferase
MSGLPEPCPPARIGYSFLDWFGAYQMALGMMAGLYRQRMTGEGCWIDSAQIEVAMAARSVAMAPITARTTTTSCRISSE